MAPQSGVVATPVPANPIAAVTHPDPYPYYAELTRDRPMYRDEALGLWVASGAASVSAVLTSPHVRVRPPGSPVPDAIAGTPVGDFFGRLVRQTDGPGHVPLKQIVSTALRETPLARVAVLAAQGARELGFDPHRAAEFQFGLSTWAIGRLLGVPPEHLPRLTWLVGQIVPGLAPTGTAEQVAAAQSAVLEALELVARATDAPIHIARDAPAPLANGLGFLTQAYEATAGLIGNTLLALAQRPASAAQARENATTLAAIVREVVRFDPPVQNTRRFVAEPTEIAGARVQPGDAILVVLAAANRDPAANAAPDTFDPARAQRTSFTFGLGPHACPGEAMACAIAAAGVAAVLQSGMDLAALTQPPRYRPSANGRILLLNPI